MIYHSRGSVSESLDRDSLREGLYAALDQLGVRKRVLAVPPDLMIPHPLRSPEKLSDAAAAGIEDS